MVIDEISINQINTVMIEQQRMINNLKKQLENLINAIKNSNSIDELKSKI